MKKILLLISLIAAAHLASAQSRFRVGFRLNPTISMARVLDKDKESIEDLNKSGKFAITTGVMATYSISEKVGFYTGALISLRGFKTSVDTVAGDPRPATLSKYTHNANLTYLEIPTALHLLSGEITTGIKIRGLFGLTHNLLFGANGKRNTFFFDSNEPADNTIKERRSTKTYKLYVPNFLVGVGIEYEWIGIGTFDLGISYHQSLGFATTKALRDNGGNGDRVRLNLLSFDIGYYF
jgi:hypothetical protein